MKKRSQLFFSLLLSSVFCSAQQTMNAYIGGNSLVHHIVQVNQTPSQETSAPHWMRFIAEAAGNEFTISGNFMSLPFLIGQNQLPLENNWYFDSVPSGWDSWDTSFEQSAIDNVVFTPMNFVQHREPYETYEFGDTWNTPIDAADTLISWVTENKPGTPLYIYEGWPDMATYTNGNFPPTPNEWANYQADAGFTGSFHEWYIELQDSLTERFPNECIKLIPVGPIISEILDQAPYNSIPIDTLYEDDAPHGRPSIYMLAGLITYMALYEEMAPTGYEPPETYIAETIREEYPNLANDIWVTLQNFNYENGQSRVFCNQTSSLMEDDFNENFKVFPNPAQTIINVETSVTYGQITLRNVAGAIVAKGTPGLPMDVSQLKEGCYFLELFDQKTMQRSVQKVIIH